MTTNDMIKILADIRMTCFDEEGEEVKCQTCSEAWYNG
jgi:hypothetical protein